MDDPVELIGTVVGAPAGFLAAPLGGRPCVLYELTIDLYTFGVMNAWTNRARELRGTAFELEAGDERVLVEAEACVATLDVDRHVEANGRAREPREILTRYRVPPAGEFRFREAAVLTGDIVRVRGVAVREPDPAPRRASSYRDGAATRLRIAPTDGVPVQIWSVRRP
ncbi:MAG: hypothetical protein K8W52_15640 [Deltaproteobacteria bacterium]|nr:hypothetical protein [Deltaproteobacteria bacterium]